MSQWRDMSPVTRCRVVECAYNRDEVCHARGITVGDSDTPACDTFFTSDRRASGEFEAGVGACKVSVCEYNEGFQCAAPSVEVAPAREKADCITFERKGADILL